MPKQPRVDLASAVHGAARARDGEGQRSLPGVEPAPGRGATKSRQGKKAVLVYVDPALRRALRFIAVEEDTTLQALCVEALSRLVAERRAGGEREHSPFPEGKISPERPQGQV